MKKLICLLSIFAIVFISCQQKQQQEKEINTSDIKKQVNKTVNLWHKAASEANFDDYFNKMDSISVFIGTDATENWTKAAFQEFSKPYFEDGKAWSFTSLERNIYLSKNNDVAWFDELLQTWMGTCRGSGVLEKENNDWKIKHYVLSVAIPNEDIKEVIIAKRENDSIFQSSKLK